MININNWLLNKLKLSQYHWLWNSSSFPLNDENQSKMKEAKQDVNKTKKVTNQKESNCWNLSIHKKTKKKKKNLKDTNMMLTILGLGWGKPMQPWITFHKPLFNFHHTCIWLLILPFLKKKKKKFSPLAATHFLLHESWFKKFCVRSG